MSAIFRFLFPMKPDGNAISLFLLALRILFGVLLLTHGMQKFVNFAELSTSFPDPLGVGSKMSLSLAVFGEVVCSLGFIFGALYRLALIPMIFTMGMAFFVIHGADPFSVRELSFIYLIVFILMYITGPGKFAVDRLIAVPLSKK
ncbi:DoxX family protein [Parabacteroides sp. PF5-9]|uniref:DoxX family protein n=1 Tax=Parabacteroides sp. PF5-9 TaxID=1742404 RepID=UPI0024737660|nr:DoxX family protein [Parabacteroides sp. PF5-9]MDH6356930.1 putative oxidoreductase [Parabacteroides sp. PF5-9]